ncbi:MAG: D-alanyl-D-alanine carboxypeptidase/D-alanyl-D-alanine-endopeptidase [Planctomycetes bacterium]|nr:D-alanyl-D-alanine carboxypeptidase/D-alanyl-D-alanine-endopeptidase [Planctomycetota bacterium]
MVITRYNMNLKSKKLLVLAVLALSVPAFAQENLSKKINNIIFHNSLKKVKFSIHIIDADNGKTVYAHNAQTPLVPASNMKIITTAAALRTLGSRFKYKTKVGLCGDTLVIIASGDPLLGDKITDAKYNRKQNWIFDDITQKLKAKGITTINGIVVDTFIFDDQLVHPNWPKGQLNKKYACEVSALNYNANCVDITTKNINGKIAVTVEPQTSYINIINRVKPIENGKGAVGAYRTQKPNHLIVKGKCKKQQGPFTVAIQRPSAFFGFLLAEHLSKNGINTKGQFLEKNIDRDCKFKKLATYKTPLTDCLSRCNKDSFGLAAEALLKTMDSKNKTNRSWEGGRKAIHKYLSKLGINQNQFYIDDASGLSRKNKLSATVITKVLEDMYNSRHSKRYKNSLAIAGIDGTLKKQFKEKKYKGKIFGKTGSINSVKSLSGICSTQKGDYIFSILANGTNGHTRQAINNIAKAIIDNN